MFITLLIAVVCSLLITAITAYFIYTYLRRRLDNLQEQQRIWERSQEMHLQQWRDQQSRINDHHSQSLTSQMQRIYAERKAWEERESQRFTDLIQQYESMTSMARVEYELARLPRVEDMPLPSQSQESTRNHAPHWTPVNLRGENISERDLSSRYLSRGDLREARLADCKLFLADLSWALLNEADLSRADLSGANFSHADLRDADLKGANLLVVDLKQALLFGADLRHVRNLTVEQLLQARYDETTRLDPELARLLGRQQPAAPRENLEDTTRMRAIKIRPSQPLPSQPLPPIISEPASQATPAEAPTQQQVQEEPPVSIQQEVPAASVQQQELADVFQQIPAPQPADEEQVRDTPPQANTAVDQITERQQDVSQNIEVASDLVELSELPTEESASVQQPGDEQRADPSETITDDSVEDVEAGQPVEAQELAESDNVVQPTPLSSELTREKIAFHNRETEAGPAFWLDTTAKEESVEAPPAER